MSDSCDGQKEAAFVSSLPDFAQIFLFLQKFGSLLMFPPVFLSDLENFFLSGYTELENTITVIHWRLLNYVTRRDSQREWQRMAVRFASRSGLLRVASPYPDLPVEKRVEIFRMACEGQFDFNLPFRAELKKLELTSDVPVGTDRTGQRYWLLKDSSYDLRLYREKDYNEIPPKTATWTLLAKSVDELGGHITTLEDGRAEKEPDNSTRRGKEEEEEEEEEEKGGEENHGLGGGQREKMDVDAGARKDGQVFSPLLQSRRASRGRRKTGKRRVQKEVVRQEEGGCLLCSKDNDYKNMLLCDECDKECHTYCLYPRLWSVPRGKWVCPLCNERYLIVKLKAVHTELAGARYQYEKAVERKQRSVLRLQRSGVLLQNIIVGDSNTDRSRRSRKAINYAELNDIYLPPLGPRDLITSDHRSSEIEPSPSVSTMSTRVSRRLRGMPEEIDARSTRTPESRDDSPHSSDHVLNSFADISDQDPLETGSRDSPSGVLVPASLPPSSPSAASDLTAFPDNTAGCSSGLIVSVPRADLAWNGTATESRISPTRESSENNLLLPPPELFTQL